MSEADSKLGAAISGVSVESGKGMGSAMKSAGGEDKEGSMNELYKVNQVWYRMPPSLSLVSKRTLLRNQFQRTTYTSPTTDTMVCIFNTGEFYIAPKTSYMVIQLGYKNSSYANIADLISQGNIMTMFEEPVLMSASGTEINREQNKGLQAAYTYRYMHNQHYLDTIGQLQGGATGKYSNLYEKQVPYVTDAMGVGATAGSPGTGAAGTGGVLSTLTGIGDAFPHSGEAYLGVTGLGAQSLNVDRFSTNYPNYPTFIVPLDQVLGCFGPYMNSLFPASALAGARLELRMKNPIEALQVVGQVANVATTSSISTMVSALQSLTVNNIYLVLDSFQMQDSVLKRLNQVSAGPDGLSVMFDTWDYTPTSTTSGTVDAQVQQARTRIIRSFCVVRDQAAPSNPYINSLAAEPAVNRVSSLVGPGQTAQVPFTGWQGASTVTAGSTINLPADNGPAGQYWQPTVTSYQAQLGSLFFPQQPITSAEENYFNALYVFGKSMVDKDENCSVTKEDFFGGSGYGLYNAGAPVDPTIGTVVSTKPIPPLWVGPYGCAVYGFLAEKSQILQLSGLPIANTRLLRHRFQFAQSTPNYNSGQGRRIDVFTQFTRVMKIYLGGRIVVRE
jgi:hypothetical protein